VTAIPNVLAQRYPSAELVRLWTAEHKIVLERQLWLAVLRAQAELGIDVPAEALADYERVIRVNQVGTFLGMRAVLRGMVAAGGGSIINVSSMIGRGAYANFTAYAAAKWGLEGFTLSLAAETRSDNIRVNSVDPGYVATKITGYRGNKPESVTDVFVYLASEESKNVSGKMLGIAGYRPK
jgi:NAD(P)-dependent dehydrogenase (short-subunit alcohol dehydrogenase family)